MFEELATNCQSYSDGGVSVHEKRMFVFNSEKMTTA